MKTSLSLMACMMGMLVITTGSPWFLLPQFAAIFGWFAIMGVEAYDLFGKKAK